MNARAGFAAASSGVVTFLFTDIEGSTRRWETDADAMRAALNAHDEAMRGAVTSCGGVGYESLAELARI